LGVDGAIQLYWNSVAHYLIGHYVLQGGFRQMEYSIEYKYEKLLNARFSLAASRKSLRDRVSEAYYHFWLLTENEFEAEGKVIRNKIEQLLTKNKAEDGYIIPHNVKHMPLKRAEEIAALILKLYDIIATEYANKKT